MTFSLQDLQALAPTIVLTVGALVLMLTEVFLRGERRGYQAVVTAVTAALAFGLYLQLGPTAVAKPYALMGGFAVLDGFSCFAGATICAGLFLTTVIGTGFLKPRAAERGEFYALCLLASAGMCLMVQGDDLLFIFIALETMSVATYALAAYLRSESKSTEAAFKYFILGAVSSAFFLFGAALCFGATGHTHLAQLTQLAVEPEAQPLLRAGLGLLLVGFAFKIAAVPFHMWAPDVYEGSPTPVTAFMAVTVKAAAFAALLRVLLTGFGGGGPSGPESWQPVLAWLSILTMLGGNLFALTERSVKRMLAYSSIAHAGYLLVAVVASGNHAVRGEATSGLLFYLAAYAATAGGAFGAVALIERLTPEGAQPWDLERFAGLAQRRPAAAAALTVLMLSLAGIPPTAGFMAKLLVFRAAVDAGFVTLAIVGVLSSLIGLYYYLRVVVYMYMRPAAQGATAAPRNWTGELALVGSALATLWFGILAASLTSAAQVASLFPG